MKRRGLIIVNGYKLIPAISYCVKRLVTEFNKENVVVDVKKSTEILVYIESGNILSIPNNYSFCVFLDKDYYISHMLEMSGLKVFNSAKSIELCDDKMKTYIELANHNIKMPKTFTGPLNYSGADNPEFVENLTKHLTFPMVIKENFGSQGSKVYLANSLKNLLLIESKIASSPRLYQELVKESWGEDYRLIVIGGKFVAGMRRFSTNGDFRSNINLGGSAELVNIPSSYIDMAEKVAEILKLDYCGVDILKGSDGPYLCEVNSNAFFMKIEEVTKLNIASLYVKHILSKIS